MSKWLKFRETWQGVWIELDQFAGMVPTGEMFCRSCKGKRAAFKPIALRAEKRPDREYLVAPWEMTVRCFCATCGWMYRKECISKRLKVIVARLDGDRCVYCGITKSTGEPFTLDHLVPEIEGGPTNEENLVLCCSDCNCVKGRNPKKLKPRFGRFEGQKGTWHQEMSGSKMEQAYMQMPEFLRGAMSPNEEERWCMKKACADLGIDPPTEDELQAMWPL